jgi:hypothetical protein
MKRVIVILVILIGGVVAYWLLSPLFITREVNESLADLMPTAPSVSSPGTAIGSDPSSTTEPLPPPVEEPSLQPLALKSGSFVGLGFHDAEGTATLLKIGDRFVIRLEDNFRITNGPDLFVHFGKNGTYAAEARLGALKGNIGGQNYEVPAGINPEEYDEVWVWCRAFSVPFGKAELQ